MEMLTNFGFVDSIARQLMQSRPCSYLALDIWKHIKDKELYHYEYPNFQIPNERSVFAHMIEKKGNQNNSNPIPSTCIVYLHGLSSFSVEGAFLVDNLEKYFTDVNLSICLYDLRGHGRDKGQNITFGLKQSKQLYQLLLYLKNQRKHTQFILWGRSMGATTILKMVNDFYQELSLNEITIKYLVLDSAFSSIEKVATEIISRKSGMPQIFCKPVFEYLLSAVRNLHNINLTVDITHFNNIYVNALFLYSDIDDLVSSEHTKTLYNQYPGPKEKIEMSIGHNDQRPEPVLNSVFEKLRSSLKVEPNLHRRKSVSTKKGGLSVTKKGRVQTYQPAPNQDDQNFDENFFQLKTEESNKENLSSLSNKIYSEKYYRSFKQTNEKKSMISKNGVKNSPKPFKIAKDHPKELKLTKKFITLNGSIKQSPQKFMEKDKNINNLTVSQYKKEQKLKLSHKNLIDKDKAQVQEEYPRHKTSIYENVSKNIIQQSKEIQPFSNFQKIDDYSRLTEVKSAFLIRNEHEPFSNVTENMKQSYMKKKYRQNQMAYKKLSINQPSIIKPSNCCNWGKNSVIYPIQKPSSEYIQPKPASTFQVGNISVKNVRNELKLVEKRHSQNIRKSINLELLKNQNISSIHQSCILSSNITPQNQSQKLIFNFHDHGQRKMSVIHRLSNQQYL